MYLTFISQNVSSPFTFNNLEPHRKPLVIGYGFLRLLTAMCSVHCGVLSFLSSLAAFEITSEVVNKEKFSPDSSLSLRSLMTHYDDVCGHIKRQNQLNCRILFVLISDMVSWLSSSSLEFFETSNWYNRFYLTFYWTIYFVTLILSAEANRKVTQENKEAWLFRANIQRSYRIKITF